MKKKKKNNRRPPNGVRDTHSCAAIIDMRIIRSKFLMDFFRFFFFFHIKADKWFFEFTRNCGSAFYTWLKYVHSILCSPIYIILLTQRFLGARASQHRHGSMHRYCTVMRLPPPPTSERLLRRKSIRLGVCSEYVLLALKSIGDPITWHSAKKSF